MPKFKKGDMLVRVKESSLFYADSKDPFNHKGFVMKIIDVFNNVCSFEPVTQVFYGFGKGADLAFVEKAFIKIESKLLKILYS